MPGKFSFSSLLDSVSKLVSEEEVKEKKLTAQQKSHRQEIENFGLAAVGLAVHDVRSTISMDSA